MNPELRKQFILFLATEALAVQSAFRRDEHEKERQQRQERQEILGAYAYALYRDLIASGHPVKFSPQMLKNRGCDPSPQFFNDISAMQDFMVHVNAIPQS